jgi:hypothetical protein
MSCGGCGGQGSIRLATLGYPGTLAVVSGIGLSAPELAALAGSAAFVVIALFCCWPKKMTDVLIFVAVVTSSWNLFRAPGRLTISDPMLLAGAIAAGKGIGLETLRSCWNHYFTGPLARFGVLLVGGGLVGGVFAGEFVLGLLNAARFSLSLFVVLYLGVCYFNTPTHWLFGIRAYAIGASANALYAAIGGVSSAYSYVGRYSGMTTHPNHFGLSTMLGAFAALCLLSNRTRADRTIGAVCLGSCVFGVYLSGSRGALVGLAIGSSVTLISRGAKALPTLVALAIPGVPVLLWVLSNAASGSSAISRLVAPGEGEGDSTGDRLVYYSNASGLIRSRPLFGSGFARALEFHSIPLQLVVVAGAFGLVAFIYLGHFIYRICRAGVGPHASLSTRAMAGALAGFGFYLFTANILYDRYLLIFLLLASRVPRTATPLTPRSPKPNDLVRPERSVLGFGATSSSRAF